jgi:hypothetical protein
MSEYKLIRPLPPLTESRAAIRLSDGAMFPFANGNTDYQTYLEWIAEGNEPLPADEPETE